MRILHTSDLHIGKKLYSSDRIEEQKATMPAMYAMPICLVMNG